MSLFVGKEEQREALFMIIDSTYKSANERDTIYAWIYTPIAKPKGIVQVMHGYLEHSRRYLPLIMRLTAAGYIVCASDHIGHGKTAEANSTWGDFGDKGFSTATADEYQLTQIVQDKFGALPVFLFGHSWGSLIARDYAAQHPVKAAVFCGTLRPFGNMPKLRPILQERITKAEGSVQDPAIIGELFEGMTERYDNAPNGNEWVAISQDVMADYAADPYNNLTVPPTIQAIADLIELTYHVNDLAWFTAIPATLPMHFIAGDQDPAGLYGEGVYHIANNLISTGHEAVSVKLYPGYRHEIHNEPELAEEVAEDVIRFFTANT